MMYHSIKKNSVILTLADGRVKVVRYQRLSGKSCNYNAPSARLSPEPYTLTLNTHARIDTYYAASIRNVSSNI